MQKFKYIYGPVSSWRLGSSLGVDIISTGKKACTFDCVYCQVGKTLDLALERKIFVPTDAVIEELRSLPPLDIDYITFSGRGEPTLAKNLGDVIEAIREIRDEKLAVLTNSSLIDRPDVIEDLKKADFVIAKLDAPDEGIFKLINRPVSSIRFDAILKGIKDFRSCYKGRFALQIMFIEENRDAAFKLAELAREISPDEVELNTPLRPSPARPLPKEEILKIKGYFSGLNTVSVYEAAAKRVSALCEEDTLRRRGKG